MDQGEQEGRIGLRPNRHPLGRTGAGGRQVRFDLDALVAAHTGIRVADYGAGAAGDIDIGADGDVVAAVRRVGGDGEAAMPELAIEVLGMHALDALAGTEAEIHLAPGGEESRESAHVVGRRAAMAEADGDARQAGLVE